MDRGIIISLHRVQSGWLALLIVDAEIPGAVIFQFAKTSRPLHAVDNEDAIDFDVQDVRMCCTEEEK